jgi:hypothetical protein
MAPEPIYGPLLNPGPAMLISIRTDRAARYKPARFLAKRAFPMFVLLTIIDLRGMIFP